MYPFDMKKELVNNRAKLKSFEKSGLITLHAHTGKPVYWYGQKVIAWYIDDYTTRQFKDRQGAEYSIEYRDGCFNPFVYKIIK